MTDADRNQPAQDQQPTQDQQDAPTLKDFTQGLRNLEAMANRLGIKAISTGHGYWPGTEAGRDRVRDLPVGPYTKVTLGFNTGDELTLDWTSSSGKRIR